MAEITRPTIKGGLFMKQVAEAAERFSDHTGGPVSISVSVLYYPGHDDPVTNEFSIWDGTTSTLFKPIGIHNDIRKIDALIDQVIADGSP